MANVDQTKRWKNGKNLLGDLNNSTDRKANWMEHVKNDVPLCRLTVPGSHDAAAFNYAGKDHKFWNCQSLPLFQQLDAGIRALDLRYAVRNGTLNFFHADALLDENATVEHIIWGLKAWLDNHGSETIFVSLKVDRGDPEADEVKALMGLVLASTRECWAANVSTETTLESVRNKLVLVRRFPFEEKVGFDVSHNWLRNSPYFEITLDGQSKARIEDFFLLEDMPGEAERQVGIKESKTLAHLSKVLDQAKEGKGLSDLWITFSSAVGNIEKLNEDVTPRVMAVGRGDVPGMNSRLRDWCKKHQGDKTPVGIILMDFVTLLKEPSSDQLNGVTSDDDDLIKLLIDRNITK